MQLPHGEPIPGQLLLPGLDIDEHTQSTMPGVDVRAPDGQRSWRGRPLTAPPSAATIARFTAKIVHTPGCHFFTGAISTPDGYGRLNFLDGTRQRTISAHRFALILADGNLAPDVVGEHECNETLCVRVAAGHLKQGTQTSNLAYAVATGRHRGARPTYGDPRGRYGRAVAIRAALAGGYDPARLHAALDATAHTPPTLF